MTLLSPAEAIGMRVKLRGRAPRGRVKCVDDRRWTWVDWDAAAKGPQIVMLSELEIERDAPDAR